jgi:hypothetical protein
MIPWLGSALKFFVSQLSLVFQARYVVPICYFRKPYRQVRSPDVSCSHSHPYGTPNLAHVRLDPQQMYIVQRADRIRSLWKAPSLSTNLNFYYALRSFFGMPEKPAKQYLLDDSGTATEPLAASEVAPHNRINHVNHKLFFNFLVGAGFAPLCARFEKELVTLRASLAATSTWTHRSNLMELFTSNLTKSSLRATCGPLLLELDPTFPQRFWDYSSGLPYFIRRIPRWLVQRSYRTRDGLIQSVKRWHQVAKQRFSPESIEADGDADPFWGCVFFRNRQERLSKVDNYEEEAIACEDFAAIWG